MRNAFRTHSKRFLSVLLAVLMILPTAAGSFAAFAASLEWTPVHFKTEYGYEDVEAGTYYIADGNYAFCYINSSLSAVNCASGFAGATKWTFAKNSDGSFSFTSPVKITADGANKFLITPISSDSVYIESTKGNYLYYNASSGGYALTADPTPLKLYHTSTDADNSYVYELDTDGIEIGAKYIITSRLVPDALSYNGSSVGVFDLTNYRSNPSSSGSDAVYQTITIPAEKYGNGNMNWTFGATTGGSIKWDNGMAYLRTNSSNLSAVTNLANSKFTVTQSTDSIGSYFFRFTYNGTPYYMTISDHEFVYEEDLPCILWLYKQVSVPSGNADGTVVTFDRDPEKTIETPDLWGWLDDCLVEIDYGSDRAEVEAAIRASEDFKVYTSASSTGTAAAIANRSSSNISFDFTRLNTGAEGTYSVPVKYNGYQIGTVDVSVSREYPVKNAILLKNEGSVYVYSPANAETGASAQVIYEDNSSKIVPITLDMLSGNFDLTTPGRYAGLTVKIDGKTLTRNFLLTVLDTVGGKYEKYTPAKSGQYIEDGRYVIYVGSGPFVFAGTAATNGGLQGTGNYTLLENDTVITCDNPCVVTIEAVDTVNNLYTIRTANGNYIRLGSREAQTSASLGAGQELKIQSSSAYPDAVTISESTGTYSLSDYGTINPGTLGVSTGGFDTATNRLVLYRQESPDSYALTSTGCAIYAGDNFDIHSIADYTKVNVVSTTGNIIKNTLTLNNSQVSVRWKDGFDNDTVGSYDAIISVNGVDIGTFTVTVVQPRSITDVSLVNADGSVYVESSVNASTGAYIQIEYEDGTSELKPITVSMLDGNYDLNTIGSYSGLRVTYLGHLVTNNFILHVIGKNDYPEYPEPGSIRVNKTAESADFANNGVARVQLSATGVPMTPGIDIVFVIDTSSSMTFLMGEYQGRDVFCENSGSGSWYDIDGNLIEGLTQYQVSNIKRRIDVVHESLDNIIDDLNSLDISGNPRDIDVAICDFNSYTQIDRQNDINLTGIVNSATRTADRSQVYTGSKDYTADAFVTAQSLKDFDTTTITTLSGTNYDRAMEEAYDLLVAKKTRNEADNEIRDQYVIFMSDGSPWQYNQISSSSSDPDWNTYLQGNYTNFPGYNSQSHAYFYPGYGNKHWTAEAIKGDPDQDYVIIDRTNITGDADVTGDGIPDDYMHTVKGLGAKMYSIGYCLTRDHEIGRNTMQYVLQNMASEGCYFNANSGEQLDFAFDEIVNSMKQAGTNAYFVDTMGSCYDLMMSNHYMKNGTSYTLNPAPSIVFSEYELYTINDYRQGIIQEYNQIGTRTGKSTIKEVVTFNADGTEAYSNKLSGNILRDGVIRAKTFTYNLNTEPVDADSNGDGIMDITIEPETFVCTIGIVAELEYVLSYDVYLTGSMEGTRPSGVYPTNDSAVLYYTNYLDHPCHKDTISPKLAWDEACISYEFYLVNADGMPVNTAGTVVPFANRVLVGNIQTSEVLLNNTIETCAEIKAEDVIPEGYILYNPDSKYVLKIDSGTTPSRATIYDEKQTAEGNGSTSTFFYDSGTLYNKDGIVPNVKDYRNTHIAFGVLLVPSVIPDAVVIDYGLPVKISALENDMSIPDGTTINAISKTLPEGVILNNESYDSSQLTNPSKNLTYDHGTVSLNGTKVTYTPTDAQMDKEDIIYYEVILDGKYYYSTITVYPAQNIYYEDDFFTFSPSSQWKTSGTRKADATQAEDRPGTFNLSDIDFNNVYGYDSIYDDTTVTHSLGTAKYTTVTPDTPQSGSSQPKAQFTFRGTGFDLFSVTSNATGYALVQVFDESGNLAQNYSVQTYYGYNFDSGEGFSADTDAVGALYQIPVIRSRGLEYGTYNVVVQPMYSKWMDPQNRGNYDFYIDGVRIYDPAGSAPKEKIAKVYEQDSEADIKYIELRSNIISANDFYKLSTTPSGLNKYGTMYPGAMFIDGINKLSTGVADAYDKFLKAGPNNELYLTKGQAIAFYLQLDGCHEIPASIQLGMKVVDGEAKGSVLVMNSAQSSPEKITVKGGAPRYYNITNAFLWNESILSTVSHTGLKSTETTGFGAQTIKGDHQAEEWTFKNTGSGWNLCNGAGAGVTLTRTEASGIVASLAAAGTGDSFRIESTNGLFTFTDSTELSFAYNGVVVGSDYGSASFYIYKPNGTGTYTRVNSTDELEDGGKYIIVYDGSTDMIVSPVITSADSSTATYRTLYPIVIMNNSEDTVSLTNFKVTFDNYSDKSKALIRMTTDENAATFGEDAVERFIINMDDYVDTRVDTSNITTQYIKCTDDDKVEGTLYVRTPSNIAKIAIGTDTVTEFTDNGDGTRTFSYTFYIGYNYETATYTMTVTDINGNTEKIIKKGDHRLTAQEISDGVTEKDDSRKPLTRVLRSLFEIVIDYFRSIIRWFTSI